MAVTKLPPKNSLITVDEVSYRWHIHHEPYFSTDFGWRGLTIHVELNVEKVHRPLLLEYPTTERKKVTFEANRQKSPVLESQLREYIREAIENGWRPDSRGKAFDYVIAGEELEDEAYDEE